MTLTGPGGVGKTRLAAVVAEDVRGAAGGGLAWIDLARVRAAEDVLPAVVDGLGRPTQDLTEPAVAATLARFRGIVVLDNCEHLPEPVAALVDAALAHAGPARLLATSRERLDVPGEQVVALTPLPVPAPAEASALDPAIRLFLDRLAAAGGGAVDPSVAAEVAAAVDGLPLAIELAAARAVTLPVDVLLEQLHARLDVLSGTGRRHGERQRTLADVIGWSHELLSLDDRTLFRRLSVFASSFRVRDVERVGVDELLPAAAAVDALSRLVEQSMVTRVGDDRYRLLEPLRLFAADQLASAADQLASASEAAAVERRHRDLILELAARGDAEVTSPGEVAVVAEVEAALPDVRAVHARAVADADLATVAKHAGRLYRFAYLQARPDLLRWGARLADADAADVATDERLRAVAAGVAGTWMGGRSDEAGRLSGMYESLLHDHQGVDTWTAVTLAETLGDLRMGTGDLDGAAAAYEQNIALARSVGHVGLESFAVSGLAITRVLRGDLATAERLARGAAALVDGTDAPSARSVAAYTLGEALADSDPDAALRAFDVALDQAARIRARFLEGITRTADVALRGRHGDPAEALARYKAALQVWQCAGADGLVLTTLRNLVVLLVRMDPTGPQSRCTRRLNGSARATPTGPKHAGTRSRLQRPSSGWEHVRLARRGTRQAE